MKPAANTQEGPSAMPEWLSNILDVHQVSATEVLSRLALAFVLGAAVTGIAAFSHQRPRQTRVSYLAMLMLLTILIAMVTIVIGNSVARAFSLVGALAIVRFRTVIEDTRDTAFVIFAVGVGLAAGAAEGIVAVLALPFVFLTTWCFRTSKPIRKSSETLEVFLAKDNDATAVLEPIFKHHLHDWQLDAVDKSGKGGSVKLRYSIRIKSVDGGISQLIQAIQALDAVLRVKVKTRKPAR
jgi:hypothetical protein